MLLEYSKVVNLPPRQSSPPEVANLPIGPLSFPQYIDCVKQYEPKRLAGIFEAEGKVIQRQRNRGIQILSTAPGTLSYDERITLLIGSLYPQHTNAWPKKYQIRATMHEGRAKEELGDWLDRYSTALKRAKKQPHTEALWIKQPTRRQ